MPSSEIEMNSKPSDMDSNVQMVDAAAQAVFVDDEITFNFDKTHADDVANHETGTVLVLSAV